MVHHHDSDTRMDRDSMGTEAAQAALEYPNIGDNTRALYSKKLEPLSPKEDQQVLPEDKVDYSTVDPTD